MTTKDLELGDLPVRTASARVRPFIPQIEHQLGRGVAMATIVAALNDRGISITASNLAKTLYRARAVGKAGRATLPKTTTAGPQLQHPPAPVDAPVTAQREAAQPTTSHEISSSHSLFGEKDMPPGMDPERWARMSITQQARAIADEKMRKYMYPRPSLFAKRIAAEQADAAAKASSATPAPTADASEDNADK